MSSRQGFGSFPTNRRRSVSRDMSCSVSLTISCRLSRFPKNLAGTLDEVKAAFANIVGGWLPERKVGDN
jgi:hypothetical protein